MFSFDDRRALAGFDLALLDHRGTVSIVRFADGHTGTHGPHPDADAGVVRLCSRYGKSDARRQNSSPHQCGDKLRVPGD